MSTTPENLSLLSTIKNPLHSTPFLHGFRPKDYGNSSFFYTSPPPQHPTPNSLRAFFFGFLQFGYDALVCGLGWLVGYFCGCFGYLFWLVFSEVPGPICCCLVGSLETPGHDDSRHLSFLSLFFED